MNYSYPAVDSTQWVSVLFLFHVTSWYGHSWCWIYCSLLQTLKLVVPYYYVRQYHAGKMDQWMKLIVIIGLYSRKPINTFGWCGGAPLIPGCRRAMAIRRSQPSRMVIGSSWVILNNGWMMMTNITLPPSIQIEIIQRNTCKAIIPGKPP